MQAWHGCYIIIYAAGRTLLLRIRALLCASMFVRSSLNQDPQKRGGGGGGGNASIVSWLHALSVIISTEVLYCFEYELFEIHPY